MTSPFRGFDSCGIGIDGAAGKTDSNAGASTVVIKRQGNSEVLTKGISAAIELGALDPEQQVRRHVGLAHTRWVGRVRECIYSVHLYHVEVARNSIQKMGFT